MLLPLLALSLSLFHSISQSILHPVTGGGTGTMVLFIEDCRRKKINVSLKFLRIKPKIISLTLLL